MVENKLISIVMPVYNEKRDVRQALEKLKKVSFKKHGFEKELIVVNDGSTDRTLEILKTIKGIRLVSYKKNRGKGFALRKGFKEAKGSVVAIQDADLEYDPGNHVLLLGEILKGAPVALGSRFLGNISNMSASHFFGNKFLSLATSILFGQKISDMETCQKMFRKDVLDSIEINSDGFEVDPEIIAKILKKKVPVKEIPIEYIARAKEFKKIRVLDGIKSLLALVKVRVA